MALNQALSGINAAQSDLNVISNNIANAGTTGFKGSRAEFSDVYALTGLNLNATTIGSGTRLADVAQQFSQGDIETTSNSLDLAISGNGFFAVNDGSGVTYTRNGAFQKDTDGYVYNTVTGAKLQVYPPGATSGTFDTSTLTDLKLVTAQSSATATSSVDITANLPASATAIAATTAFSPSDSTTFNASTPVTVYDSLGTSHQGTVYYTKRSDNTWEVNMAVDGQVVSPTPPPQLTFDANGKPTGTTDLDFAYTPGNGANGMSLAVDFSTTTQFGTAYSAGAISQNGYQAGTLSSIDIDSKGVVTAYYSNNQSATVGQIAVANFSNLQGLRQLGDTSWAASADSGVAVMGTADSGQFGTIQSGALETSNTADTTSQLVDMIKAQRNYQANAQVLTTDNTLASTLFNSLR